MSEFTYNAMSNFGIVFSLTTFLGSKLVQAGYQNHYSLVSTVQGGTEIQSVLA